MLGQRRSCLTYANVMATLGTRDGGVRDDGAQRTPRTRTRMGPLATLVSAVILLAAPSGLAHADAGDLDPSFDGDGMRTLSYGGNDAARAVLVQPDGKIVVAGYGGAGKDFAVSRLHTDGSLDTGFDGDGTAVADFGGDDQAYAAALQPDGNIVVAGSASAGMAVARFRSDGSLDASFDPGGADGPGKKLFAANGEPSRATAVLVQLDGRIVLAHAGNNGNNHDFGATRLNPDGSVDSTSFDLADFGGSDSVDAAALQPDGKIVLAGTTYPQPLGSPRMAVARYNADGSLDATFSGTGKRTFGTGETIGATAVQVQPDGKIVVAGYGNDDFDVLVTRLNRDGGFDTGFGTGGTSAIVFSGLEQALAAVLQPDGKIVVAGVAALGGFDVDFAVARLQPGGALDTAFATDGKTTLNYGAAEFAYATALQADGRIVLAGSTLVNDNVALARLEGVTPPGANSGGAGTDITPAGASGADRVAPILSRFSASPRRFRAGRASSAAAARPRRGTTLTLQLSEPASVRFDAHAASTGRRVGTRCHKPTRANRKRRHCTLRMRKGGFSRSLDTGRSRLAFRGRLRNQALRPGRYTLRATPKDAQGNTGKPRTITLRIAR